MLSHEVSFTAFDSLTTADEAVIAVLARAPSLLNSFSPISQEIPQKAVHRERGKQT